jgi:predicted enzyme related to lactoylglutathione lyase
MPEFTSHAPGTFSWPELATTDQKAGAAFYAALFGWEADEQPIGPSDTYTMFKLRHLEVAAASSMRPEQRDQGVPSHWNAYITVANADATAARAVELGGKVLAPPFDVMDAGRMAVLQDPTGAIVSIWQAGRHIGARMLREPGALGWTELTTRDTSAAERFYTQLFGWTAKAGSAGGQQYTEFSVGGQPQAGMMPMNPEWGDAMPGWMPYFQVGDCNATHAKAIELGAQVYVPPTDIPGVGRFTMLADPQGAMFAVIAITNR